MRSLLFLFVHVVDVGGIGVLMALCVLLVVLEWLLCVCVR